ncbi:hypothetical protein COLO4_07305 [Corchorus olitorius]|uniref:Uncharacterized protein n=1 Tax=Corchorus olitorius TaxID=93759 RepID=A0A1R3KK68_9ROSI|nr:hypothetical protein COLO4_07305 [Corchorus olitorius]
MAESTKRQKLFTITSRTIVRELPIVIFKFMINPGCISSTRDCIRRGTRWRIGDGNGTKFWTDWWGEFGIFLRDLGFVEIKPKFRAFFQDVQVEDNVQVQDNDDLGEVDVNEVNLEGLAKEDVEENGENVEDEGPSARPSNCVEFDGEGTSEFHIDNEYDDSDEPLEIETDEELIVNEATTRKGRFPRYDSTAEIPYICKSMLFKNSDEFKLAPTTQNSTTPSHEEVNCNSARQNSAKTKKKAQSSSKAVASVQIPDLNANAKTQAVSSISGNAEASASVVVPTQQSATTNPAAVNSSSKAQSGPSKKKKANSAAGPRKKTRFSIMDENSRVFNVSGERSSPASQAKYAHQRPVTATSLQHDAQKKFRERMEALKSLRDCNQHLVETMCLCMVLKKV